MSCGQANLSR